jgi:hypothetical protein
MRQVTNKDIYSTFLGESTGSPKLSTRGASAPLVEEVISADFKSALKEARLRRRANLARKRAKKNKTLFASYDAKRKAVKTASATNARAFVAEFLPSRHSEEVKNWSDPAPVWGDVWVSPLDERPTITLDNLVKCDTSYGLRKLWSIAGGDIGNIYPYFEHNTVTEFVRSVGFEYGTECRHSERGMKVIKLREFVGFHKAISMADGYSPLFEIQRRAYSGCGANSPHTGKPLFEYTLFKERGFFASPQAIDNMLWKVVDAFKRITGRNVSYELALDAMGYSLVPRKAVIIMLANRAGVVTSSYQRARQALVEFMPKLKELNLKLGDLLNRQSWCEGYWRGTFDHHKASIDKLAIQKASKGKVVDFCGNYNDAVYWTRRMRHDDKCLVPGWLREDSDWRHPSKRGIFEETSLILGWLKSEKTIVDGVETAILRTFVRGGLKIHKAQWVNTPYIYDGFVIEFDDGFTYHSTSNRIAYAISDANEAHLKWLDTKPVSMLKREFERVSDLACPLVTMETSKSAGNCLPGTLEWLRLRGLPTDGIIGLEKIIDHLTDEDGRFKMVVMEALQRTKKDLGM